MSLLERLDVPAAKSRFSISATVRPRVAASSATPHPVTPPPITRTSKVSVAKRSRARLLASGPSRDARTSNAIRPAASTRRAAGVVVTYVTTPLADAPFLRSTLGPRNVRHSEETVPDDRILRSLRGRGPDVPRWVPPACAGHGLTELLAASVHNCREPLAFADPEFEEGDLPRSTRLTGPCDDSAVDRIADVKAWRRARSW